MFGDSTISATQFCCKHSADHPKTTGRGSLGTKPRDTMFAFFFFAFCAFDLPIQDFVKERFLFFCLLPGFLPKLKELIAQF